jgi:hypothetical protein
MRAYSHQGHGPRADQQAGYISATSASTPYLRIAAGPYIRVKLDKTHCEHNKSAFRPIADMRADTYFRRDQTRRREQSLAGPLRPT